MELTVEGPIVLVGLSGAGKSRVAPALAEALGWEALDLDAEVERLAGRAIPAIFEAGGEEAFRDLEARATRTASPAPHTVIAAGGGWMTRPELRDAWPESTRVWLKVSPAVALERLASERLTRPLLAGRDPREALEELDALLASRSSSYALAEIAVDTDGRTPAEVGREILAKLAR